MAKEAADKNKKVKVPSAKKRDLQSEKQRIRNRAMKARIKTAVRRLDEAKTAGKPEETAAALNQVYSMMDRAAKSGLFKQNKAARSKSRLAARVAAA